MFLMQFSNESTLNGVRNGLSVDIVNHTTNTKRIKTRFIVAGPRVYRRDRYTVREFHSKQCTRAIKTVTTTTSEIQLNPLHDELDLGVSIEMRVGLGKDNTQIQT